MTAPLFIQAKATSLLISISEAETTEIKLKNLVDVYGNALAMADFGTTGYLTIDPGGDSEEIISFTGFTVNSDSSVSIDTGITRGLVAVSPYGTGGTASAHAAGVRVVVSNNPQMYDAIIDYIDGIAIAGVSDASETAKGIVEEATQAEVDAKTATGSTGAPLFVPPDKLRTQLYNDYVADTGAADAYEIAPNPAITAYAAGQEFTWKATNANTGAATLDVNSLGAKAIYKNKDIPLAAGDILAGQIVKTVYDGAAMTLVSKNSPWVRVVTAGATVNGATLPVPVYQNKTDNEFYACDANDTAAMKFLGFATSNGTDGNDMVVQFGGIVGGFSSLDEGEKYYVQDTAGAIGTTTGTYEILVGVAISPTELLIQKGRRRMTGSGTFVDQGASTTTHTTDITLGFRPSVIRLHGAIGDASGTGHYVSGTWNNGNHKSVTLQTGAATVDESSTSFIAYTDGGGDEEWRVSITSVTDTGFTFSAYQYNNGVSTLSYIWEAEGEL